MTQKQDDRVLKRILDKRQIVKRASKRARVDGPPALPDVPLFDGTNFNTWLGAMKVYWGEL